MGRREKPVDPDSGPVQRLAHELRELREQAGKPPYREMARRAGYSTSALSQAAAGDQLPTLAVVRAYAEALGADPGEWEVRWRETDAQVRAPAPDERAPYRGLARFEPGDSDLFFGREALVDELLGLVREHRFAAVCGPSGSGKSSLLRAGLIPALRQATGDAAPGMIRVLAPGERPARTHEQALVPADGERDTWVIVDQFEELFTLCRDRAERDRFLDLLLAARRPDSRLRVVLAVRGDFYDHCASHRELAQAVGRASLLVGPMGPGELREMITGPATAVGLNVERALTARIIEEVHGRPGALPMLSHALLETWRRRRGRTLLLTAYEETGGVRGAIATTAERVYGELSGELSGEQARATARLILLRLIAVGSGPSVSGLYDSSLSESGREFGGDTADTRRPARRSDFGSGAQGVLERLASARLVTLDGDTVELSHEALISGWPRLAGWIEESRERLRARHALGEAAGVWEELGRDPGALYRGTRLTRAEELFALERPQEQPQGAQQAEIRAPEDDLTTLERAFLTASLAAREAERTAQARTARRTRVLAAGLSAFLVLALAAGLLAWQRNQASEAEAAKAEARRLAGVADSLRSTDPRAAALLGVAAWESAPLTESRSALLTALAQPERDAFTDPQTGGDVRRYLTDEGRTLLSVTGRRATAWNVSGHRRTGSFRIPDGREVGSALDGRTLELTGEDGDELWNLPQGRSTADLGDAAPAATAPDGGAYLTAPADGPGLARVHRTKDGKVLFAKRLRAAPSMAAVGPGGRLAALCPASGPPQVWDTTRSKRGKQGTRLSGAWDKAGGTVCGSGSGADSGERRLRFSGDGRRLAAVSGTTATVWDVRSGRAVAEFDSGGDAGFSEAALSPDGDFLATADDQEIAVWRLAAGGVRVFHSLLSGAEARGLTWGPGKTDETGKADGKTGKTGKNHTLRYLDGATVRTYDLSDRLSARWQHTEADATALSPDGTALATATRSGDGDGDGAGDGDGDSYRFALRSTRSGKVLARASLGKLSSDVGDGPPALAFSPDGGALAVADTTSARGSLRQRFTVWDVRDHKVRTAFETSGAADRPVSRVALGPEGRSLLALRSRDGKEEAEVWNTGSHRKRGALPGISLAADPGALALRPDGRLLVGSGDQYAQVPSGRLTGRALADGREVTALAFSPDGTRLAVGDATGHVTLWDGDLRHRTGVLSGASDTVTGGEPEAVSTVAFSADGDTLAVGGAEGTLRLWDVPGQQRLGTDLPTPGDPVQSLSFSGDGKTVYAAGPHTVLQRYPVAPDAAVRAICKRAGGGLSRAQWRRYVADTPYRRVCGG